ncbi:MAG: restriction endonuclease [Mucilaginibacter sp.]
MFTPVSQISSWSDLQEKVRDFFEELGYKATTNKPVNLANGGIAEVDVYAVKGDSPLAQKILFECKYWNSDVPRSVVQSFKMDVQEAGANFGIIVSKKGFQSGAYQGVSLTTVKLYTFEELQAAFAKEWSNQNLMPVTELYNLIVDLYRHFESGTPEREFYEWSKFNDRLKEMHDDLWSSVIFPLGLYKDYFTKDALAAIPDVSHTFTCPHPDGSERSVNFNDVRSMSKSLKLLFEHALCRWSEFQKAYSEEFMKLTDEERKKILGINE